MPPDHWGRHYGNRRRHRQNFDGNRKRRGFLRRNSGPILDLRILRFEGRPSEAPGRLSYEDDESLDETSGRTCL